MRHKGENIVLAMLIFLVITNLVGVGIPTWYNKHHEHHVNGTIANNVNGTDGNSVLIPIRRVKRVNSFEQDKLRYFEKEESYTDENLDMIPKFLTAASFDLQNSHNGHENELPVTRVNYHNKGETGYVQEEEEVLLAKHQQFENNDSTFKFINRIKGRNKDNFNNLKSLIEYRNSKNYDRKPHKSHSHTDNLSYDIFIVKRDIPNILNNDVAFSDIGTTSTSDTCTIHMNIREGLWQRFCIEETREGQYCEIDVQEWCDNVSGPSFNTFVLSMQICGDFILFITIATIVRSKFQRREFNLEMVATGIGVAGILMLLGITVFVAADTGDLNYQAEDLHAGWGLCLSTGVSCIVLGVFTMVQSVLEIHRRFRPIYLPLNDEDDELIEL